MKKIISIFIIFSLLLSLCLNVSFVFADDKNIIFSESFEDGTFLNNWEYMNDASLGFVRVTDSCSTVGNKALYIWDDKNDNSVGIKSSLTEITPGNTYTLVADVYRKSATICVYIKFYTSDKVLISSATKSRIASGSGWRNYAVVAVAPPDAKYVEINLVTNASTEGYGYYDNVKIIEGEASANTTVSGITPPDNEEIFIYDEFVSSVNNSRIYSESFEYGIKDWSDFENTTDLNIEISASNKASGVNSLHVWDNSTTSYPEIYSPKINVNGGDAYKLIIKSKKISGSMAVHYKFYNSEDALLENVSLGVQGNGSSWYNASKTVIAPNDASYLKFYIVGYTNTVGEWYFDDLEVYKVNEIYCENFESGLDLWSDFENTSDMIVEISDEENVSGQNSLHIIDKSTEKAPLILSSKISVKEGAEYIISAAGKRISGSMTVNYRFFKENDIQISNESVGLVGNGSSWYYASKTIVAPEEASYMVFVIAGYTNTLGEWYIDDIILSSTDDELFDENVNEPYPVPVQNGAKDSQIVVPDGDKLIYKAYNEEGDKLSDYSYAGFYNGEYKLPATENFIVETEIYPDESSADDTARIQNAIDQASKNAGDGMRVVKLKAGKYKIGPIGLKMKKGVILSGEGQGPSGTILYAYAPVQYTVISASGVKNEEVGTHAYVTDSYIKSGSKTINVSSEDALNFQIGDLIAFKYPYTDKWVEAMEMDDVENFDGNFTSWSGRINPTVERRITAVNGTELTLDYPFFIPYDQSYNDENNKTYIVKLSEKGRMENIGIENLRLESYYNGSADDEKHALYGISLQRVENAFVRDVTGKHLYSSLVRCVDGTKKVTVLNCSSLDPVSQIQGDRRYSFFSSADTQEILFTGCYSYGGRHDFSTSSYTSGPIAFVDNVVDNSNDSSETHSQWSVGVLYDNVRLIRATKTGLISLANRGKWGTSSSGSHGWTAAGSVVWNSLSSSIIVHKPSLTYENFAVGIYGAYVDDESNHKRDVNVKRYKECYGVGSESYTEENFYNVNGSSLYGDSYQENQIYAVNPQSLYKAQLAERITGSIKNARPNSPTLVYPSCDLKTSSQTITFEGFCDMSADSVAIYVDDVPYDAVIDLADSTYTLDLTLGFGTHKVYATQTVDGNEGVKTADRFISIGHVSEDISKLQSIYEPSETTLLLNDNRDTFDTYLKESSIYIANNIIGSGTSDSPYIIDTVEKFRLIFGESNNDETTYSKDKHYKITENLTIDNHKSNGMTFRGSLVADENKTLNFNTLPDNGRWLSKTQCSEMGITYDNSHRVVYSALFAVADGATIKNITLKGTMTNSNSHHQGAFCAVAKSTTVENCINYIDMTGSSPGDNGAVGGFIGAAKDSDTTVINCINYGMVTGKTAVGGIIGNSYAFLYNSKNYGNVTGTKSVGGILGDSNSTVVSGCENYGDVTATTNWALAGGIIGCQRLNVVISQSVNYGKVTLNNDTNNYTVGGIVGYISSSVYGSRKVAIKECMNVGDIVTEKASSYPGAFVGFTQGNLSIENSLNLGNVGGGTAQGRVVGDASKLAAERTIEISNYYDVKVKNSRLAIGSATNGIIVITNTYGLSDTPDETPSSNSLINVSEDVLKALITSGKFSSEVWEIKKGNLYPYPTLKNATYYTVIPDSLVTGQDVYTSDIDNTSIDGNVYYRYALLASKAPETDGFKLKEFGVITGFVEEITLENCKHVFTSDSDKICQPSGAFGCLIFNKTENEKGLQENITYYIRSYAVYEDILGKEHIVYGTVKDFTFSSNS